MYLQMFDIAMMLNFFNIKSQLKLSLLSLIFCLGVMVLFSFIYILVYLFSKSDSIVTFLTKKNFLRL